MKTTISFTLNGTPTTLETDPERRLLWALRGELGLTGAKYGCGAGHCGSCTVIVDGRPVRACVTSMERVAGATVLTIEGLALGNQLHPLQRAFITHGGLQCGYCTPGMIMSAYALLEKNPAPSRAEIIAAMDRNLCRCAAHQRIVAAIEDAAAAGGCS